MGVVLIVMPNELRAFRVVDGSHAQNDQRLRHHASVESEVRLGRLGEQHLLVDMLLCF